MDNNGPYSLGSFQITAAGIYVPNAGAELIGLSGAVAMAVQLTFDFGAGGGEGVTYLQTSLDQANEGGQPGGTWLDIAAMSFGNTSKMVVYNFSGLTPRPATVPGDGVLTPDTSIDGILGDRFRLKTIVAGSILYSGPTAISGRLVVR